MAKLAIIILCALAACGPSAKASDAGTGSGSDSSFGPLILSGIEVTPTNPIVELDLNQTGSQAFTAMGHFSGTDSMDITDRVNWTVVNPAVGTLTNGSTGATLAIPAFPAVSVEVSRIRAELDGIVGEAQITVVAYRRSGGTQDFFFVLPYMPATGQVTKPLDFGTAVPALDVFFLTDTTGSMGEEIANLRNSLANVVVPGIQGVVSNSQFGVGAFEDFPVSPYGYPTCSTSGQPDQPLRVFQTITSNVTAVQNGMANYLIGNNPRGCGLDWAESSMEGLYQVATAAGLSSPSPTNVPATPVGFRTDSMPVIVTTSDAFMHGPGETATCVAQGQTHTTAYAGTVANVAHSRAQTKTALANICARSVGVASFQPSFPTGCSAQADLEDFATATGARVPPAAWDIAARPAGCSASQCCTGQNGAGRAPDGQGLCPLVFLTDGTGAGIGTHIVNGITMLARFAQFDVTSDRSGGTTSIDGAITLPSPRTTADFIKLIIPTGFMLPMAPPVVPNPTFSSTTFFGVTPGTRVQFDVRALNDFVPQTGDAQIFRAIIRVLASGCTALDQREVLILVPPNPIVLQ